MNDGVHHAEAFWFIRYHLLIIILSTNSVLFSNVSLVSVSSRLSPLFSFIKFSVSDFHVEVIDPFAVEFCAVISMEFFLDSSTQ